jgi:hypothetical protein
MAKLNRESKLRDKRVQKQARRAARRLAAASDAADGAPRADELGAGLPEPESDAPDEAAPRSRAAVSEAPSDGD